MRSITTRASSLIIVALFSCWGSTALAQNPLQSRMSLTYQGTPAGPVLQALADVLGFRLQLDDKVTGAVTLDVRNVTAETVLRAICESIGCRWRVEKGTLYVDHDAAAAGGTPGQADPYAHVKVRDTFDEIPVQISWNGAPVDAAIKTLARMLDAELSLDRALSDKRITLSLNKDNPRTALNAICEQAGCQWRMLAGAKRILRVIAVPRPGSPSTAQTPLVPGFAPGVARFGDPGVSTPKVLSTTRPRYTPEAMRAKIQGDVVMQCVVEADGTVGNVRIIKSLDKVYGLDDAAVEAARMYVFEPGTRAGKSIPVVATISVNFTLR
jgi:TonB family protein